MADIARAIADLQFMRKTHVDWAEYYEANPDEEAKDVGTRRFDDAIEHRRLVACYDNAIACLEGIKSA